MKVYILLDVDTDDLYPQDSRIVGVFVLYEGAEAFAAKNPLTQTYHEYDIQEWEVQ